MFAVGRTSTPLQGRTAAASRKRGTIFSFRLDQPATVTMVITTSAKCPRAQAGARRKPRCARTVATLTRSALAGLNKLPFSGRIRGRPLKPGDYRAVFAATSAGGSSGPEPSASGSWHDDRPLVSQHDCGAKGRESPSAARAGDPRRCADRGDRGRPHQAGHRVLVPPRPARDGNDRHPHRHSRRPRLPPEQSRRARQASLHADHHRGHADPKRTRGPQSSAVQRPDQGRPLKPGCYETGFTATNSAGDSSPQVLRFTVSRGEIHPHRTRRCSRIVRKSISSE